MLQRRAVAQIKHNYDSAFMARGKWVVCERLIFHKKSTPICRSATAIFAFSTINERQDVLKAFDGTQPTAQLCAAHESYEHFWSAFLMMVTKESS